MAEKSNAAAVRALIAAAFHEGTLEHRNGLSHVTLQKARDAREKAEAAVLARMCGPGEVVVPGWQPIETAPKDGSWFQGLTTHNNVVACRFLAEDTPEGDAYGANEFGTNDGVRFRLKAWQPLAAAPRGGNDDAAA